MLCGWRWGESEGTRSSGGVCECCGAGCGVILCTQWVQCLYSMYNCVFTLFVKSKFGLCFEIFRLEESIVYASLGNLRLSSFALKHSPGNFSCVSVVWKLSIWDRSLEIFRRGCFAWELRLETFVWYASLGNLCLSSSALQLSMGNFCLGSFAWELSFGSFVFLSLVWEPAFWQVAFECSL